MPDPSPPPALTPFRDLPADRQLALREAWGAEMARQGTTCDLDAKIARFAAWLAPQGIGFGPDDLPLRRRG
jgi:hypothetical protein